VRLEQVPLPTFIQVVYAEVFKKSVTLDPQVLARKDLVTFRSGDAQSAAQVENAVRLVLKSYGVDAVDVGGVVRVVPDTATFAALPEIRRGSALPETPLPLRPVFQLVDLQAVRQVDVVPWLKTLFGERIKAQEDASRNALLISGTPSNMEAALEALRVLDQPVMSGRKSLALTPAFWSADDLARRLAEVLLAEGYAVQPIGQAVTPGGLRFPVILLPVSGLNAVFVFSTSDAVSEHVAQWAKTLDRPNERGVGKSYFTYAVKHTDAGELAKTLDQLISGRSSGASGAVPAAAGAAPATTVRSSRVVVDKATNTLIVDAATEDYSQIVSLLQTLDRPSKAALIEVTVAELSTSDTGNLGIEWLLNRTRSDGRSVSVGTLGGLALGTAGLNVKVLNSAGDVRAVLNALASTNRATILSSPRVLARNGETATMQVGQDVPIVTGSTTITSGNTGVVQAIQYRTTGVILRVKPVIHSGDQIDLDVSQEVSAAQSTSTGVSNSPTIQTRKVETKLTLQNGATVLLGGLISSNSSHGDSGVPGLKDIPLLGNLFSNKSATSDRTELIVLITPYVVNDNHDAEVLTESFKNMLGPWASQATSRKPAVVPAVAPATAASEPAPK
jgi:general secretion pathway protein D